MIPLPLLRGSRCLPVLAMAALLWLNPFLPWTAHAQTTPLVPVNELAQGTADFLKKRFESEMERFFMDAIAKGVCGEDKYDPYFRQFCGYYSEFGDEIYRSYGTMLAALRMDVQRLPLLLLLPPNDLVHWVSSDYLPFMRLLGELAKTGKLPIAGTLSAIKADCHRGDRHACAIGAWAGVVRAVHDTPKVESNGTFQIPHDAFITALDNEFKSMMEGQCFSRKYCLFPYADTAQRAKLLAQLASKAEGNIEKLYQMGPIDSVDKSIQAIFVVSSFLNYLSNKTEMPQIGVEVPLVTQFIAPKSVDDILLIATIIETLRILDKKVAGDAVQNDKSAISISVENLPGVDPKIVYALKNAHNTFATAQERLTLYRNLLEDGRAETAVRRLVEDAIRGYLERLHSSEIYSLITELQQALLNDGDPQANLARLFSRSDVKDCVDRQSGTVSCHLAALGMIGRLAVEYRTHVQDPQKQQSDVFAELLGSTQATCEEIIDIQATTNRPDGSLRIGLCPFTIDSDLISFDKQGWTRRQKVTTSRLRGLLTVANGLVEQVATAPKEWRPVVMVIEWMAASHYLLETMGAKVDAKDFAKLNRNIALARKSVHLALEEKYSEMLILFMDEVVKLYDDGMDRKNRYGRYLPIVLELATADTKEDITEILDQVAAPVGSWRMKRDAKYLGVNAFVGYSHGREQLLEDKLGAVSVSNAIFAPIGLDISWPTDLITQGSSGVYLSVFDVGNAMSFREEDDVGQSGEDINAESAPLHDGRAYISLGVGFHTTFWQGMVLGSV